MCNTSASDTITTIIDCASGLRWQQEATYHAGTSFVTYRRTITNISGSSRGDLRFFHGQDTFLNGGDQGSGFYDSASSAIGVRKTSGGSVQTLSLQATTPLHPYESCDY